MPRAHESSYASSRMSCVRCIGCSPIRRSGPVRTCPKRSTPTRVKSSVGHRLVDALFAHVDNGAFELGGRGCLVDALEEVEHLRRNLHDERLAFDGIAGVYEAPT